MRDPPAAFQFPRPERERDERAAFQFCPCDPGRENSSADANLHELLDRLHAAELDEIRERYFFFAEIFRDEPEGLARLVIEHEGFALDRLARHAPDRRPRMQW